MNLGGTPAPDSYWTLAQPAEGLFKAKGSKHFGFVFPLTDLAEVTLHLQALRKLHHAARHHCYAYRWGATGEIWRAQDDGEPAHSAGTPILGALRSREVTHCLAVVVRYFGGTKLGVGGLMEAYREATLAALDNAQLVEKWVEATLHVTLPCHLMGETMRVLKLHDARPDLPGFGVQCEVICHIRKSRVEPLLQALNQLHGVQAQVLRTT